MGHGNLSGKKVVLTYSTEIPLPTGARHIDLYALVSHIVILALKMAIPLFGFGLVITTSRSSVHTWLEQRISCYRPAFE
ncbi:MAG: hypothetical protein ACOVLE_12185 [Pirellula staleyi]